MFKINKKSDILMSEKDIKNFYVKNEPNILKYRASKNKITSMTFLTFCKKEIKIKIKKDNSNVNGQKCLTNFLYKHYGINLFAKVKNQIEINKNDYYCYDKNGKRKLDKMYYEDEEKLKKQLFEQNLFLSNAYTSGFRYKSMQKKHKQLSNCYNYDVNSAYPYCAKNIKIPIGKPIVTKTDSMSKKYYKIFHCGIDFGRCPYVYSITTRNNSFCNFLTEPNLIIGQNDFYNIKKNWKFDKLIIYKVFNYKTINNYFQHYVDYWYKEKLKNNEDSKAYLNLLFGKLGQTGYYITQKIIKNPETGELLFSQDKLQEKSTLQIAIPIAINDYHRERMRKLFKKIELSIDKIVMVNVDNILTTQKIPKLERLCNNDLGMLKRTTYDRVKFANGKMFYLENGEIKSNINGVPKKALEDYFNSKKINNNIEKIKKGDIIKNCRKKVVWNRWGKAYVEKYENYKI